MRRRPPWSEGWVLIRVSLGPPARFANNTTRFDHLYQDPHESDPRLVLHYGDLTDSTNLIRII
jgi:GDP-D-mannose dehydratase